MAEKAYEQKAPQESVKENQGAKKTSVRKQVAPKPQKKVKSLGCVRSVFRMFPEIA